MASEVTHNAMQVSHMSCHPTHTPFIHNMDKNLHQEGQRWSADPPSLQPKILPSFLSLVKSVQEETPKLLKECSLAYFFGKNSKFKSQKDSEK